MSHDHSHGCGDGCDHDHDIPEAQGYRDSLYPFIDKQHVVALNVESAVGSEIIKPWDQSSDETVVW